MQHIINKLSFDINCADEQQALSMRERFLREVYTDLTSVMEACCNRVSDEQQLIQIGRLEVNLQTFKSQFADKRQYVELFEAAFREALNKKITSAGRMQTLRESHCDILIRFLETGTLPWWANEKEVDLDTWCDDMIHAPEAIQLISWLRRHKTSRRVWRRIMWQLPLQFKVFVVDNLPELKDTRERITIYYDSLVREQEIVMHSVEERTKTIIDFILTHADDILKESRTDETGLFPRFLLFALSADELDKLPEAHQKAVEQERGKMSSQNTLFDKEDEPTAIIEEEKLVTGHAGVILLAAFLKNFFINLKLWGHDGWVSDEARSRAVYLVSYLVNADEPAFEYQLTLEKIICGMPLHQPIDRGITLTDAEKREAEDLLQSVIQHWSALKNTSVNGLRHAFLQRQGLLLQKENGWQLQVEQNTVDVLMEQLPWGYAMVSLPWNNYIIYTTW